MGTINYRLRQMNSTGAYDIIHLETSAAMVKTDENGTTLLDELIRLKNASGGGEELKSHIENKENPHGVTALQVKLSTGATVEAALAGKADTSHGVHVVYGDTPGAAPTTSGSAGSAASVSRSDHTHPLQTTVSGNAGSATVLANSQNFQVNLASTSAVGFNGSAACTMGVSGILGIGNGGTGGNTAIAARSALGAASILDQTTQPTTQNAGDLWFETIA